MLDKVLDQLHDYGLQPDQPLMYGKLTRCRTKDDKGKEKNGWYVLHEHLTAKGQTLIFGSFGDWRLGETQKVKTDGRGLTPEEREVMRARQADAKRRAVEVAANAARRAAKRAEALFMRMPEKGRSAYLDRKQVVGFGVRYAPKSGAVLVPMQNAQDAIVGLQVIFPTVQEDTGRDKSYWPHGMAKDGAFHMIGGHPEPGEPVLVCEGYATGASLHMATSQAVAIAFDAGNLMAVAKHMRERFPGRSIIICRDDDWKTKRPTGEPWNPGEEKANNAAVVVGGQVVGPIFSVEREVKWTDFNDLHCAEGLDAVRRQVTAVIKPPATGGWKDMLARTESGALIAHMQNVELILANDERWGGVIGYNAFSSKIMRLRAAPYGGVPGEWSDIDDMRVMKWLAQQGLRVKASHVVEAVSVVAHDNAFHPVCTYLAKLEWDRVPRLERWLHEIFGVPRNEYSAKVGKRWMISAVARVMKPGCKADAVMILEGAQGAGKSSALGILGGEWFMDTPFTLGDKDAFQAIRGKWIVELGELDSFNKAESTKAKQFFSASIDTYRESYGRRTSDVPRQCVFAGTTNQDEYLKDATGNRRYWPVACVRVDLEALRRVRDQLWAEAMFCYQAGDIWWVTREEEELFTAEQEERFVVDEWGEGPILKWLEEAQAGETVTGSEVLGQALNLDPGHWGKPEQMRVGSIMHRLGWRRRRLAALPKSGKRPWAYQKPDGWGRTSALEQQEPLPKEECF